MMIGGGSDDNDSDGSVKERNGGCGGYLGS